MMEIYITCLLQILSFSSPFRQFEMKNFLQRPTGGRPYFIHVNPVKLVKYKLYKISNIVKSTEAMARRCSVKKMFLEISQNSQENACARVSFLNKVESLQLY